MLSKLWARSSMMSQPQTSLYMFQMRNFAMRQQEFKSYNPAHSSKSQRGLYHGKTHGRSYKISFSDKKHPRTLKPNVHKKTYYSEILGQKIKLPVSTKAMKCIVKAGCLDNYILYTKPEVLNSTYGEYLRDLMKKKQADPEFEIGHIKLQAWARKNRR